MPPRQKNTARALSAALTLLCLALAACSLASKQDTPSRDFSPVKMEKHGDALLVLGHDAKQLAQVNSQTGEIERVLPLGEKPNDFFVKGDKAFIAAGDSQGTLYVVDLSKWKMESAKPLGHFPVAIAARADTIFAADRFADRVLIAGDVSKTLEAIREPIALALAPKDDALWVCNFLPAGRADGDFIAAAVSVFEGEKRKDISLPNGAHSLRALCFSPDGNIAVVSHVLSRYALPATQVDKGWMNTNAVSLFDAEKKELIATVLLDEMELGAANPWALAFSADGKILYVSHAGTGELSVIDFPVLLEKLDSADKKEVSQQLGFLSGMRRRVQTGVKGPRALLVDGGGVYVAGYFSDDIVRVNEKGEVEKICSLGEGLEGASPERRGHSHYNDASLCFQTWQSCVSCHPDARADGLNWDLTNDGIGNPKNTRSIMLSHFTPPVMTLGIRKDAETAVRRGFKHIQFVMPDEQMAKETDAYLRSLRPANSPRLNAKKPLKIKNTDPSCLQCHAPELRRGSLSESARRGKEIFKQAGCVQCHPHPFFTDMNLYDVGTLKGLDAGKKVDTPTLIEAWRTGPYLHDGRAATLEEAVFDLNKDSRRGRTNDLNAAQKADLIEYLKSL